ncbi:MAG: YncE family protein [Chitinophagaceae bacterium]
MPLKSSFYIHSEGHWDYLAVAPQSKELYVSHGTQVNILNKITGDSIGVIPGTIGVHGIAFVPALGKGFISNGKLNNVFVFNLKTHKILDSIKTGENPDAIFYEPFSEKIITCNGRSKDASVIDPKTEKVVATIPLCGKPETAVSDGKGLMFVNIEDKNEVVVVNMKTMKLEKHYPLNGAEEPTGLAINPKAETLFVGCGNKKLVVMRTSGEIIQTLPIGDHCDGTAFDNRVAYASCGDGTLAQILLSPKTGLYSVKNYRTKAGARTITIDPETHNIYVPTAEFIPLKDGEKGRAKMIPGSFQILVFGAK